MKHEGDNSQAKATVVIFSSANSTLLIERLVAGKLLIHLAHTGGNLLDKEIQVSFLKGTTVWVGKKKHQIQIRFQILNFKFNQI